MPRKAGNRSNKRYPSCDRLLLSPSSKRTYVRKKTNSGLQPNTAINDIENNHVNSNTSRLYNHFCDDRTYGAARVKKSRDAKKLKDMILDNNKTKEQQALVLHTVLSDPDLSHIIKLAGIQIRSKFEEIAVFSENRRLEILKLASDKNNEKGRVNDDKRSFIESQLVSISPSPIERKNNPSIYNLIKHYNIPKTTGYRKINEASMKRKIIFEEEGDGQTKYSSIEKRKKYCKITPELRESIIKWLHDHPHIISSPIYNDTLLFKDSSKLNSVTRVGKMLRQISMRELHNDLLSKPPIGLSEVYDKSGIPIISDTSFRNLLPSYIKPMSDKYKQMCGCEVCILATSLQNDLNSYRLFHLRRLEKSRIDITNTNNYRKQIFKDGKHIHPHPKDALQLIQCPPIEGFNIPHMQCILRRCPKCPKFRLLDEEKKITDRDPKISFHFFQKIAKCSIHGIIRDGSDFCPYCKEESCKTRIGSFSNRKQMVLLARSFSEFIKDYYLPTLEKYAYHRPHFILLGKNESGALRRAALKPGDFETTRDYAERLSFKLDNEIMSLNFGNSVSLSMEGVSIRHFSREKTEAFDNDKKNTIR